MTGLLEKCFENIRHKYLTSPKHVMSKDSFNVRIEEPSCDKGINIVLNLLL